MHILTRSMYTNCEFVIKKASPRHNFFSSALGSAYTVKHTQPVPHTKRDYCTLE